MIDVKWIDRGREPQMASNPGHPNGIDVDLSVGGRWRCKTDLPYPAKRCGYYAVKCQRCGYSALITTAGRPDDPRSVTLPCQKKNGAP